jgi:hypothetical protein
MSILKSRVEAVKLYHSGAMVYRVAQLEVPEGEQLPEEVEIQELPLSLFDATVRVRVEPEGAGLLATDVRVGLHALSKGAAPEDPDLGALKKVEREAHRTLALLQQIDLETSQLRSMNVPERPTGEEGKPPPASPMAARVLLEGFCDGAVLERTKEARSLGKELKRLKEEAAEIRDQMRRASSARVAKPHDLRKTVVARLARGDGAISSAVLHLEYYVPGARWAPAYQCRLSRDCQQAEIQLRALVCQRSGEDWRGVKLILSTASPLGWTELPELSSIRVGRAQPGLPEKRGFRPPPRGAEMLLQDYNRDWRLSTELVPARPEWRPPQLTASAASVAEGEAATDFVEEESTPVTARGRRDTQNDFPVAGAAPEPAASRDRLMAKETSALSDSAAPPAPAAPMRRAAPQTAAAPRQATARAGGAAGVSRAEEPGDGSLAAQAAAEAYLFSQLRLPPPHDLDARGRLVPVDVRQAYRAMLDRARVEVRVDVLQAVAKAQRAAVAITADPLPLGAIDVRQSAGFFDFCYESDARVDVESDGAFHSLALGTRAARSKVRYICVPREDTGVYRMATLVNPLASPLLPGPVEVHVGGDYVLTTHLPTVGIEGEFQLGLGVEQGIKVARNTRFSEKRSGTKVVAMAELHHVIEVELKNQLAGEILCEVRERIPQPAENAEVVVEESAVDPPWEVYDQRERQRELLGGRRWEVTIGAGACRTLRASYVVKIYANNELAGGNRREA